MVAVSGPQMPSDAWQTLGALAKIQWLNQFIN